MKPLQIFLTTLALGIFLVLGLNFKVNGLPPLGKVINPFSGVWQNHRSPYPSRLKLAELKEEVVVRWDKSDVPHVFAQSRWDLYLAQGYLVARDRLWQMDLQTRVGAGRLSEHMGERTQKMDEFFTRIGMRDAAQKAVEEMNKDPETRLALDAYTKGVNAYIRHLNPDQWPVEYKLTDSKPELWTPLRTAYLLKLMSFRLSGRSYDLYLTQLMHRFGRDKVVDLFPDIPHDVDPIMWGRKSWVVKNLPRAAAPFQGEWKDFPKHLQPFISNGSNSWAVGPSRSKTGHSIVANDTHLAYSLPPIWYEMQLSAPGLNVYGATFAGAPGIIIGFNEQVSWAVTNALVDVVDWYEVEFKDEHFNEYRYGDQWKKARHQSEVIHIRGADDVTMDLVWTHHGVVVARQGRRGMVVRWGAHRPSNELQVFLNLNQAQQYRECKKAVRLHQVPAQNFICADASQIGIFHQGRYPKRYPGQGRFVLNGSDPQSDWQEDMADEEKPSLERPKEGFVRSANQHPADASYPYYLNWGYSDSYRGKRIRQVLSERSDWDGPSLGEIQMDDFNLMAQQVLPLMIQQMDFSTLTGDQKSAYEALTQWNFKDEALAVAPSLFHHWWNQLQKDLYEDQFQLEEENLNHPHKLPLLPHESRTLLLVERQSKDPQSPEAKNDLFWIDDIRTDKKETLKDVLVGSFQKAFQELTKNHGPDWKTWKWSQVQELKILHMARIPGFGSKALVMGGSTQTVNANQGRHGAVWRMVVELGPELKAWANYPGGQTGNPMDVNYTKFLEGWSQGKLRPVLFLKGVEDQKGATEIQMVFHPKEKVST